MRSLVPRDEQGYRDGKGRWCDVMGAAASDAD